MALNRRGLAALAALAACRAAGAAAGASISSCGGPADVFQVAELAVAPDPIEKGRPFTITVSGKLGANLTSGSLAADLDARLLVLERPIIDARVRKTAPFSLQPGLAAGDVKFVVGPVAVPGEVPGSVDLVGKLTISDAGGAQVACIALDLHIALLAEASVALALGAEKPAATANCTKPGDHMRDVRGSSAGGSVEVGGTLDEDVAQMAFDADLWVHLGAFRVPLRLSLPVAFSPGLRRGPVGAKFGPARDLPGGGQIPKQELKVTGQVTWNDEKKEEIACVSVDFPGGASGSRATLVV